MTPGIVLQAAHNPQHEHIRFGLTVTKKVGNAVVRNRVRRRLRALALAGLPGAGKPGFDYVLIGRVATISRPHAALVKDLETALKRVHDAPGKTAKVALEERLK